MHKIARKILLIYLIIFMGPLMAVKKNYSPEEDKLMTKSVYEIIGKFANEMYDRFGFTCGATGAGMPYDVETIIVKFALHKQVSIEEARELEIKTTERLVEIINEHEAIRPYLREYPWIHKRAEVCIAFYQKNGKNYEEGVRLVLQARDKLIYFAPDRFKGDSNKLKEEPYEEAKKIVDTSPSCLTSFKPPRKKFLGIF